MVLNSKYQTWTALFESDKVHQCCGSRFIESGSGSSISSESGSWSRVLMTKNWKKYSWKKNILFWIYSSASLNNAQATGEAFSPQKSTSSTSKHELSSFFSIFECHFCPPVSGSGSRGSIESGSGSTTLRYTLHFGRLFFSGSVADPWNFGTDPRIHTSD